MDEQPRPAGPEESQGSGENEADTGRERRPGVPAAEQTGKLRPAYLDPSGSESTRELRDTARRRRDAEEKLQQHLMEAKHHVPNEFHEHGGHGHSGHGDTERDDSGGGRQESRRPGDGGPEKEGDGA